MSRLSTAVRRLRHRLQPPAPELVALRTACRVATLPQSVLFLTHNKCASTFVTKLLARTASLPGGMKTVDYEDLLWNHGAELDIGARHGGPAAFLETMRNFLFCDRGVVYGPLRTGCSVGFDDRFKRLFFLRDPRDALVSNHHSIAHTHPFPKDPMDLRRFQLERARSLRESVDDYALRNVNRWIKPVLSSYREMLVRSRTNSRVFLYEDFVCSPADTVRDMLAFITDTSPSAAAVADLIRSETFVQATNQLDRHQRCGAPGQYRELLRPTTIARLNNILRDELDFFWDGSASRRLPLAA